jgi:creatinine amidohydrolase/Fe(II)-dependent formamide hydrolase-like protein
MTSDSSPPAMAANLLRLDLAAGADLSARPLTDDILLLPVAALENHGPHLPLATDAMIGEDLAVRVGQRLAAAYPNARVWLHPPWHVGAATIRGVGSVKVPARIFRRALLAYLRRFLRQGFRRFILVSAHGGVPHVGVLDDVCSRLNRLRVGDRPVQALAPCAYAAGKAYAGMYVDEVRAAGAVFSAEEVRDLAEDLHAGRLETAMMLAIAPEHVREIYRTLPDLRPPRRWWLTALERTLAGIVTRATKPETTRQRVLLALRIGAADLSWIIRGRAEGYVGWPSKATAVEGEALLTAVADDIARCAGQVFDGRLDPRELRSPAHLFRCGSSCFERPGDPRVTQW